MIKSWKQFLARWTDDRGVAAVEFALVGPMLIFLVGSMIDYAYGYNVKLKVADAVTAGAVYAFNNGQDVTAADAVTFLAAVKNVVTTVAEVQIPVTVETRFNNDVTGANASSYYCVDGYPAVWTSTGQSSVSCGGNIQSGRFVTITVSGDYHPLFLSNPVFARVLRIEESIVVRVQ